MNKEYSLEHINLKKVTRADLYGSYIWELLCKPALGSAMSDYVHYLSTINDSSDDTKLCFGLCVGSMPTLYLIATFKESFKWYADHWEKSTEKFSFMVFEKIMNGPAFKHFGRAARNYYFYDRLCRLLLAPSNVEEMMARAESAEFAGIEMFDSLGIYNYIWIDGNVFDFRGCSCYTENKCMANRRNVLMSIILSPWWQKGGKITDENICIKNTVAYWSQPAPEMIHRVLYSKD